MVPETPYGHGFSNGLNGMRHRNIYWTIQERDEYDAGYTDGDKERKAAITREIEKEVTNER